MIPTNGKYKTTHKSNNAAETTMIHRNKHGGKFRSTASDIVLKNKKTIISASGSLGVGEGRLTYLNLL